MYFILQYIEYQEFKNQPEHNRTSMIQVNKPKGDEFKKHSATRVLKSRSRSLSGSKPSIATSMVETLHELNVTSTSSIENKEVLINPDCYLGSILDYIIEVVGLPRNLHFTMCTASSIILTVRDSPLSTSGLEFFVPKETYYIILKDYDYSGNEVLFPLLHKYSEIYSYLSSKFRNDFVEQPRKQSLMSSSSSKTKSKEVVKPKGRVKSGITQKEGKTYTTTLPPIKQRN